MVFRLLMVLTLAARVTADEPVMVQISDAVVEPPPFEISAPAPPHPESLPPGRMLSAATPAAPNAADNTAQPLLSLQADLDAVDGQTAMEFSRLREGLSRLDAGFDAHLQRQRSLAEEIVRAREAAEQATKTAERERRHFETLLAELPPAVVPEHAPRDGSQASELHQRDADHGPGDHVEPTDAAHSHDEHASEPPPPAGGTYAITETAVDRPALADSLYGAQRFDVALRLYEQLADEPDQKSERTWYFYQMASCHRHLGSDAKALKFYRIVSGTPEESILREYARWWLTHLERREELRRGLEAIRSSVAELDTSTAKEKQP